MFSGMLTGGMTRERAANLPPDDHRSRNPEFKEPKLSRNLELVDKLKEIGARHGRSSGEAALAWTLIFGSARKRSPKLTTSRPASPRQKLRLERSPTGNLGRLSPTYFGEAIFTDTRYRR
jgi:aryl-alcohol dehydrogenase-like predicted oxidoreductase